MGNVATVGVISDTHGVLPEQALAVLRGEYIEGQVVERLLVDVADPSEGNPENLPLVEPTMLEPVPCSLIVHAGDIGNANDRAQWVLDVLVEIAPVKAVLGNCDYPGYTVDGQEVGQFATFETCGVSFAVLHEPEHLYAAINGAGPTRPAYIKPKPRVRIHGHIREPKLQYMGAGIQLCPGSVSRPSNKAKDAGAWAKTVALVRVAEPGFLVCAEIVLV